MKSLKKILLFLFFGAGILALGTSGLSAQNLSGFDKVLPRVVTSRTGAKSLAGNADDPAIWVHPEDPSRSLIFGVDKGEGTWVWTLEGKELCHIDNWGKPGNIDVSYDFQLGDKKVDIVALNLRKVRYKGGSKIAVYAINKNYTSGDDVLQVLCDGRSENNDVPENTYGFALYRSVRDGKTYVFESPDEAPFSPNQHLLEDDGSGRGVRLSFVRTLEYSGDVSEGMVADEDYGFIYIAEENQGVHQYYAEPDKSSSALLTFAPDSDGYSADREGVALYRADEKRGYILVVDQGGRDERTPSIIRIYDREGSHPLVKTVVPLRANGKNLWDDDGVAACASPLPGFPCGIVVAHDGDNSNFPVYDWSDIAGNDLLKAEQ